jgi:hypothetical protein
MQQLTIIDKNDLKQAFREVLQERQEQTTTTAPPEPEQYIHGLEELAKFLQVGLTTAWKLSKKIPCYRSGKKMFFKKNEVLAALNQRR